MTKTVTISATRANGDPYAHHDVIVTLIAGSAGGVVGSTVVVESSTVRLDADGEGSIVLATNDTGVESPTGSFYRFTVAGSSPTITRSIELTDALPSTVSWTLAGIQVADPTDPQRDVSSDYVTVPVGTMPVVESVDPPTTQSLTNLLASTDATIAAVATGGGVALGETSTTAYRGDRGKTAYDHSQVTSGNPHGTTAADVGAAATGHDHSGVYQPLDADLTALAGLTSAADKLPYFTGSGTAAVADFTAVARTLLASSTITAVRAALGFGTAKVATDVSSNVSPSGTTLVDTTGLSFTVANGTHYVFRAVLWVTGESAADIDVAVTAPSGTLFATGSGLSNAASSAPNAPNTNTVTTSGARITGFGTLTGGIVAIVVEGTFTATANGTVQIQHSQRFTNATATVVKAGSTLTYFTA